VEWAAQGPLPRLHLPIQQDVQLTAELSVLQDEQLAEQHREQLLELLVEQLLEHVAIQLHVQLRIQVKVKVKIQVQIHVSTQVTTRLKTLWPVLPDTLLGILLGIQARLSFDAGLQKELLLTPTLSSKRRGQRAMSLRNLRNLLIGFRSSICDI
jgi:hypothetical protein